MKKNLASSDSGATAVEFALLAIPYVFLMVGIIELAIMYAAATLVEGAAHSASRLVRTGQLQQGGGDPETVFRDAMCGFATALVRCNDIVIEAQTLTSFTDTSGAEPQFDEDGNLQPSGFETGGSNDKVMIRAGYTYDMITPFIGPLLAGNPQGQVRFMSTVILQTEPYNFGGQ